jgi:hypothetical protein
MPNCVTCFVMLAREYSGLGLLVFCSSVSYVVVVLACKMTSNSSLPFYLYLALLPLNFSWRMFMVVSLVS